METYTLYLGPLHSCFLNLLFWTIHMSPVTGCPWFGSVIDDVVQLQGKLFILSKMPLVSNVLIDCLLLNILGQVVLVNVYNVENCVGKFFFTFLSFIILLMFIIFMPLFTKCNFFFVCLVLVVFDVGGL